METFVPKTLDEFIELFFRRKKLLVIPFVTIIGATIVTFPFLPRVYESSVLLAIEDEKMVNPLVEGLAIASNVSKKVRKLSAQVLSYRSMSKIAESIGVIDKDTGPEELEAIIVSMKGKTTIKPKIDNIIEVKYEDPNPELAQLVSNAIATKMVNNERNKNRIEAENAIKFIEEQLLIYKGKLDVSERSFLLNKVSSQLAEAVKKRQLLEQNPVAMRLQNELTQAEIKLNKLLLSAKEGHPLVQDLKSQIKNLRRRLIVESQKTGGTGFQMAENNQKYVESLLKQRKQLDIEISSLRKKLNDLERNGVKAAHVTDQEILSMERNKRVNEDVYKSLLVRLENANISQRLGNFDKDGGMIILEPARLPDSPAKPKPIVVAGLGLFFAILAGVATVFIRETLDSSFRNVKDAKNYLTMPFLGYIPRIEKTHPINGSKVLRPVKLTNGSSTAKNGHKSRIAPEIVTYHDPESRASEQFRLLRTNILSYQQSQPLKTLLVTSALDSEGKTTTSVNLAMSMAFDMDQKVLIVDADIRRGGVGKKLGIKAGKGITDYLAGSASLQEIVHTSTEYPLSVLTSGTHVPNPTRLFERKRLQRLWDALMRAQYDFIVVDSAPVLALADVPILTPHMDGVLFVVQAGRTGREQVETAQEMLVQTRKSKILGYVLAQVQNPIPSYVNPYLPGRV